MEFKTVAVCALEGSALDWAVGVAEGNPMATPASDVVWSEYHGAYNPSTNWSQGGPLIEKHHVWLSPPSDCVPVGWDADVYSDDGSEGSGVRQVIGCPTALIAACRAIVAAKLGKEVSVPASLLKEPS